MMPTKYPIAIINTPVCFPSNNTNTIVEIFKINTESVGYLYSNIDCKYADRIAIPAENGRVNRKIMYIV